MDLSQKKCKPCEGGVSPLHSDAIQKFMAKLSRDWQLIKGRQIEREFKFKNFKEAMAFVKEVAALAENEGHHPDINVHEWNKVKITLSTHSIGGLSENDFIVASKIEQL